jgi:hypothetical protein
MNSLLGLDLPIGVNFIIAFVVVLALIGAATWMIRRFGATKLDASGRGRQPRLAVTDTAAIDGRRKLVIVRRDNVEHLLMIGGPNDVVVESSIVRSAALAALRAGAIPDPLPRTLALPDDASWPLAPEPTPPAPARLERERDRRAVTEENPQWPEPPLSPAAETAAATPRARPTPVRDPLAGLAAELAKPAEPAEPQHSSSHSPSPPARQKPAARPAPTVVATVAPAPPEISAAADKNLAEMAKRLEAALRQPGAMAPAETRPTKVVVPELKRYEAKPASRPDRKSDTPTPSEPWVAELKLVESRSSESKSSDSKSSELKSSDSKSSDSKSSDSKPAESKADTAQPKGAAGGPPKGPDNLEQEMASLLGRTGKS